MAYLPHFMMSPQPEIHRYLQVGALERIVALPLLAATTLSHMRSLWHLICKSAGGQKLSNAILSFVLKIRSHATRLTGASSAKHDKFK
eukprot:5467139-Pleurochrysis_carterae.AAC.1